MDLLIWIAFLAGATALLFWLWRGNRERRERWREWCTAQGWRIEVDRAQAIAPADPVLPRFPISPQHVRREGIDLCCRGRHGDADAASWEWTLRSTAAGRRSRNSSNSHHALALRLPSPAPARLFLLPRTMTLLSMSGALDAPDIDAGIAPVTDGWRVHAADRAGARAWLQANRAALERPHAPDLVLLLVEGDRVAAWFPGEVKPERIVPTLDWLSGFAAGR